MARLLPRLPQQEEQGRGGSAAGRRSDPTRRKLAAVRLASPRPPRWSGSPAGGQRRPGGAKRHHHTHDTGRRTATCPAEKLLSTAWLLSACLGGNAIRRLALPPAAAQPTEPARGWRSRGTTPPRISRHPIRHRRRLTERAKPGPCCPFARAASGRPPLSCAGSREGGSDCPDSYQLRAGSCHPLSLQAGAAPRATAAVTPAGGRASPPNRGRRTPCAGRGRAGQRPADVGDAGERTFGVVFISIL